MKSIHTFDVFAPTDEQEEAMNKKRGGHYRRGKNKEMDYFIECATSLFPNNHYSRFTPIYDTINKRVLSTDYFFRYNRKSYTKLDSF